MEQLMLHTTISSSTIAPSGIKIVIYQLLDQAFTTKPKVIVDSQSATIFTE